MERIRLKAVVYTKKSFKMFRKCSRPLKRLSNFLTKTIQRTKKCGCLSRFLNDIREILEYSQIEGFNHLANIKLHVLERWHFLILFISNPHMINFQLLTLSVDIESSGLVCFFCAILASFIPARINGIDMWLIQRWYLWREIIVRGMVRCRLLPFVIRLELIRKKLTSTCKSYYHSSYIYINERWRLSVTFISLIRFW